MPNKYSARSKQSSLPPIRRQVSKPWSPCSYAVTAAHEQERAQLGELAAKTQEATGESVELAFVD
jgi:hypothetical protein